MPSPTPEQWTRIKALFAEALDQLPSKRESFIAHATDDPVIIRDVHRMLNQQRADEDSIFLGQDMLAGLAAQVMADEDVFETGHHFDDFEIIEELGRGGMGVVYRARQQNPSREVAIKVIRPESISKSTSRRFEHESELLARLNHPGIAQIYATGFVDIRAVRRPYFVMELVEGEPITSYCWNNALPINDRLELIAKVCDAVQHAHQKGVIHRDLKPSNLLIDQNGRPRIIDFGVAGEVNEATITQRCTQSGELLGTLVYMSPEQFTSINALPDTRYDVYALGVIAYELLCEQSPFDLASSNVYESIKIIEEHAHVPLSHRDPQFQGDLETVISKAMAKDRSTRYSAASDFAADLRRFIAHDAVLARAPSMTYQIKMYARRNRIAFAGILALLLALIVGITGIASTAWQWNQTRQQVAMRELAFRLFIGNLHLTGKETMQEKERDDLHTLSRWLLETPQENPAQTMWLCDFVGTRLNSHGDAQLALDLYELAFRLKTNAQGAKPTVIARSAELYAETARRAGEPWLSKQIAGEAADNILLSMYSSHGPDEFSNAEILWHYKLRLICSHAQTDLGEYDQSEQLLRKLVVIFEDLESASVPDEQWDVISSKLALARVLIDSPTGSPTEAIELIKQISAIYESRMPKSSVKVSGKIAALNQMLGEAHLKLSELDTAEDLLRKALKVRIGKHRDGHPNILTTKHTLARVLFARGNSIQAREIFQSVVHDYDTQYPNRWRRWIYHTDLARCLIALGHPHEARSHLLLAKDGLAVLNPDSRHRHSVEDLLDELSQRNSSVD